MTKSFFKGKTPMTSKGQGPILLAGQTASGKSDLALQIAEHVDGVIVNADSMQVYRELQILTARPTLDEMGNIPHELYGHVAAETPWSVGRWLDDMASVLKDIQKQGKRAIITGGTGLYFKALLEGLSPVPEIAPEIREKWRQRASDPDFNLHRVLAERDPEMAGQIRPQDRQRLARALEVIDQTGQSLLYWQQQPDIALLDPDKTTRLVMEIDRDRLYERCNKRFDRMMDRGALDEVEALLNLNLSSTLPVMRALGVRPLAAYLSGNLSKTEAVEKAKAETRQYAKRQSTWIRGNMISWNKVVLKDMKTCAADFFSII